MNMIFNKLKKHKILLIIILVIVISFCYTDFICPVHGDEVWSYGFSVNIAKGLIPYRDFNVIVTPLYFLINSFFIKIFGHYLFIMHIFDAFLIGIVILMLFKIIGYKSLIIWPFLIFFCPPSYNLLCVFWIFLILYLVDKNKDSDVVMGLVISFLFLTKQTVGIVLFIITLYYSKRKFKFLTSFMIPILFFLIFLIVNDALFNFIDYCFLGMFDFQKNNGNFNAIVLFETFVFVYLLIHLFKNKNDRKEILYILMFQIMVYPIFDFYHFLLSVFPVVYYFVKNKNNFCLNIILSFVIYILFICLIDFKNISICFDKNYLFLRNYSNVEGMDLDKQVDIINSYGDNYDYQFYILYNAYLLKLYENKRINKFDLLNNGNMGYNGSSKYIEEIDSICNSKKCVFYVKPSIEDNTVTQFNKDIFNYVVNNYNKLDSNEYFDIYSN